MACARRATGPEEPRRLALWLDESYRYVQLFTGDPLPDVQRRSLAVEPMTCPANAFRDREAMVRLEPGSRAARAPGGSFPVERARSTYPCKRRAVMR